MQHATCEYCGSALDDRYYFCPKCATPYRSPDDVVSPRSTLRLTAGMRIAATAPAVAPLFWTYVAVLVGTAVVSDLVFTDARPDLAMFFADGAILATTCIFAVLHWPALRVQLARPGFDRPVAWLLAASLVPLLWINGVYHAWVESLGGEVDGFLNRLHELGVGQGTLVVSICLLPAISEEIAFRGLVQHWLERAVRPGLAISLAAALFSAVHFSIVSAPYLFLVGVVLGVAKWKTRSLYPSMVIHFVHNLFVIEVLHAP